MKKIVVFGPGPGFKGGIANFSISLAKAFAGIEDTETHMVSWTHQYPFFIPRDFIDDKSQTELLEKSGVTVQYTMNYNNFFTWQKTYQAIVDIDPDFVVIQWSSTIQAFPIAYLIRELKSNTQIRIIADLHFGNHKEYTKMVKRLATYAIKYADAYVVHSYKTAFEVKELFPDITFDLIEGLDDRPENKGKPILKLYHPIYDMFTPDPTFDVEAQKKQLHLRKYVFLFFGFIIKYKGLHNAILAFAELARTRDDVSLLIVGESSWQAQKQKKKKRLRRFFSRHLRALFVSKREDETNYQPLDMIDQLGIRDCVTVVNEFIPNEEVYKYYQVSDAIALFYETATSSGVESIAYNFKLPIVATRVGHFPETVKEGVTGYLADPGDISSMTEAMQNIIDQPIPPENFDKVAKDMSWASYARSIKSMAESIKN
ncbi:MAG: glycosyltransferase [Bacteroidales bacterium]|jgi:glycosyltransferase involved in cell wall biosynthesis|nr:glycosyltransferase [Bacteroidales bacterium]